MPYLKAPVKELLDNGSKPLSPGQLNYRLTQEILEYLYDEEVSYERLNSILGVLEAVKLEVFRRVVIPYENEKKITNGDVF